MLCAIRGRVTNHHAYSGIYASCDFGSVPVIAGLGAAGAALLGLDRRAGGPDAHRSEHRISDDVDLQAREAAGEDPCPLQVVAKGRGSRRNAGVDARPPAQRIQNRAGAGDQRQAGRHACDAGIGRQSDLAGRAGRCRQSDRMRKRLVPVRRHRSQGLYQRCRYMGR